MKNVVNCALAAKKKIFLLAFLAVFSSFNTMVWGEVNSGDEYTWNSTTKTLTIHKSGDFASGVMTDFGSSIDKYAPWKNTYEGLATILEIEDGITYVGKYAFNGFSKLTSVTLPTSIDSIGENAFYGCKKMANIYYEGTPAQWVSIGLYHNFSHPFRDSGSESRNLYFYGITTSAPSTVFIEPTITKIKKQVFNNVKSISCICIPGTVESIGDYAFYNCSGLTEIIINRHQAPSLGTGAFNGIGSGDPSKVQLYKPSTNSGYGVSPWSTFTKTLGETSPCATIGTLDEGSIPWTLDTCGILTIDARGLATKSIEFNKAGENHPWGRFRRMVYKIVLKGEITGIGYLGRYHFGLSEILLDQTAVPTSQTNIALDGSAYNGLFNKRDKLTLSIKSASEGHANLSSAPWNDATHWNIVVRTCPDWGLHYGTDKIADWDEACFTYTGSSNEWQIENFVIPNKPNWYVDNAAGNDAKKKLSTWGDLYFAASQGDGDRPMVGDAVGAIGTVRIYDNSNWNNRYAGFIPNGYVLKIGSNKYSFASEDGNEYRSKIIEYSGSNARDNVSVGIVDANGDFVSTNNTSQMQHIFLNTGGTDLWSTAGVTNFGLYDVTNGNWACLMTAVPGVNYLYEGWVPSNCTTVSIHRLASSNLKWKTNDGDASNTNVYNSTNDLALQDNQNLWTVTGWGGGDGSWSAYTQKGRFCIWQSSTVKNWGVCFRPCYEFNNTAGDGNWNTAGNWKPQSVPTIDSDVFLNKPVTVNVTTAQAKSVVINQEGDNTGQLVVDAGQKLIVAGSIQKTTNGEKYSATEANDIIINSDAKHELGLGALVMGTHDGTNQATVNFTTLSNGTSESDESVAQYVGTPFNDETNILHNWYNSWVYGIAYTSNVIGWERVNEGQGMTPFKGYCVFSADGTHHNYWQQGTLVASENQTISDLNWQSEGIANPNNENLLANSWMAPIKINAMEASDFTNTEATVYIFNSTSASDYEKGGFESNYTGYTPGTAGEDIIPAMQSFSVFTNAEGGSSVSLDYNKIVYTPAINGTDPGPNRAPLREAAEEANKLRLFVRTESGYGDLLYMWERSDFSEAFENGWDGHKLFGESVAPQLFALSPDGDLAINCIPTFEGVQMGFKAGEQDNSYTFTFEYSDEAQPLYLLDIQTNIYTQITSATSYSFTTTDTEVHNRFVLTYNAPSAPTALETTPAVTTGKKVMYDNHLFILHNGRIFSAQGAMIQ